MDYMYFNTRQAENKSLESRNYKNITTQIRQHQKPDFLNQSRKLYKIYKTITSKYTKYIQTTKAKINNQHYKYHPSLFFDRKVLT
jgi:predicted negative regulator of RcsB-dependent stress response